MKQRNFSPKFRAPKNAPRGRNVTVKEKNTLLAFLFSILSDQSKSAVKSMLSNRQITINGRTTTQFDEPLAPGDEVGINYQRGTADFRHPMLKIVWEDDYLIVVEKRSGLLSMATAKEKERTAYHLLSEHVKKSDLHNRIFILHRLDKETSGVMMFAKDRTTQNNMQNNWNDVITRRTYLAVVEGYPERDSDLITTYLTENAGMKVYVSDSGQEAVTRYKLLKSNGNYSLLELDLETGRKNQIRAHMESIGHPVAGDIKYGAQSNPAGRLMLHASNLNFIHPVTNEELRFQCPCPPVFNGIVKKS